MITLKLRAGLGNQLFQYAYGRAMALRALTELAIDTSWYSSISPKDTPRTFLLDKYNIQAVIKEGAAHRSFSGKIKALIKKVAFKIGRDIFKYSDYVFYPALNSRPDNSVIEGFWNTEMYFKEFSDTIRKELTLKHPLGERAQQKERALKQLAQDGQTLVLIHVRRGDYVTNANVSSFHGAKDTAYYSDAIKRLQDKLRSFELAQESARPGESQVGSATVSQNTIPAHITFVLASDDMKWVKESIVPLLDGAQCEMLSDSEHVKDYEEIYLMSLCHHFIIANSSFSWWGAWLSTADEKIVIGPKAWTSDAKLDTKDVMPTDWIRI